MYERKIDLEGNSSTIPASTADTPALAQYECPRCHSMTYAPFAPFFERGVLRWCSACGYSLCDKETHKRFYAEHPEEILDD